MSIQESRCLIEELEKLNTLSRIFRYGPLSIFILSIHRLIDRKLNNYIIDYLETVDVIIIDFQKIGYKINIQRYELGETFNRSYIERSNNSDIYENIFNFISSLIEQVIRVFVDYAHDNDIDLAYVNSTNSLRKLKSSNTLIINSMNVITTYPIFLSEIPNRFFSSIIHKHNVWVTTELTTTHINRIERYLFNYINTKFAVSKEKSFSTRHH